MVDRRDQPPWRKNDSYRPQPSARQHDYNFRQRGPQAYQFGEDQGQALRGFARQYPVHPTPPSGTYYPYDLALAYYPYHPAPDFSTFDPYNPAPAPAPSTYDVYAPYTHYRIRPAPPTGYYHPSHPAPPSSTFDFRAPTQHTPNFSAQPPPAHFSGRQQHQRANNTHRRPPHGNRGQAPFPHGARPGPSERPLMRRNNREPTPELMAGMTTVAKFKALEDLEDIGSEAMDTGSSSEDSDDDDDSRTAHPTKKARLASKMKVEVEQEQKPKWSNPDPYYVNPPTYDASKKKTDVVQLIRKARAEGALAKPNTSSAEDFIAFDLGDDDSKDDDPSESMVEVVEPFKMGSGKEASNKKKVNNFSHLDNLHPDRFSKKTEVTGMLDDLPDISTAQPQSVSAGGVALDVWPPPPPADGLVVPLPPPVDGNAINVWPPPAAHAVAESSKGKRKRGEEDDHRYGLAPVAPTWRRKAGKNAVPWWKFRTGLTVEKCLHSEIADFWGFVRPLDYESSQRHILIDQLQRFLNRHYRNEQASIDHFGSFGAGLYLPDGDMDLVVRSGRYRSGGAPVIGQNRKQMNIFAGALLRDGLARHGSTLVIAKSKVPIIKYVDERTGLRVDISFENSTGVVANTTYTNWINQYPVLPALVTLVKQFLYMRDLNDVSTGGIGGFTITCLVVSMLQLNPTLSRGGDLGAMFLHFLDFYGNRFNSTTQGICLNPPHHFRKDRTHLKLNNGRPWALCIQDPNRPDNDISGGSKNVREIFSSFSEAHSLITKSMESSRKARSSGESYLTCILAGDYSRYEKQRDRLKALAGVP